MLAVELIMIAIGLGAVIFSFRVSGSRLKRTQTVHRSGQRIPNRSGRRWNSIRKR